MLYDTIILPSLVPPPSSVPRNAYRPITMTQKKTLLCARTLKELFVRPKYCQNPYTQTHIPQALKMSSAIDRQIGDAARLPNVAFISSAHGFRRGRRFDGDFGCRNLFTSLHGSIPHRAAVTQQMGTIKRSEKKN